MKKMRPFQILLFMIIWVTPFIAGAQSINLQSAIDEHGSRNYGEALKFIERAQEHPKTKNDPKTWFYRGQILKDIASSKDSNVRSLHDKPVKGAMEAYQKCRELGGKDQYQQKISQSLVELSGPAYDRGIKAFGEQKHEDALEYFMLTAQGRQIYNQQRQMVAERRGKDPEELETDSISFFALYNAARSAQAMEKDSIALRIYSQLSKTGFFEGDAYLLQAEIYDRQEKYDQMLKVIEKGLEKYPDHIDMIRKKAQHYIVEEEDYAKAEKGLEQALKEQPENENLKLILGTVYKDLHDQMVEDSADLAKDYYGKAESMFSELIGKDSSNYEALSALGLMYYNMGVELNDRSGREDDDEKRKDLKDRSEENWENAIPVLRKAFEVGEEKGQETENVVRSLMKIYARLNMPEEYKQLKKDAGFTRQ